MIVSCILHEVNKAQHFASRFSKTNRSNRQFVCRFADSLIRKYRHRLDFHSEKEGHIINETECGIRRP
jgi:hypothetical protein